MKDYEYESKETIYNNITFRSELEAKWAWVFDKLGITYEYEPIRFNLDDKICYTPDFCLFNVKVFSNSEENMVIYNNLYVEIKPNRDKIDFDKLNKFCYKKIANNQIIQKHNMLILCSMPSQDNYDSFLMRKGKMDTKLIFSILTNNDVVLTNQRIDYLRERTFEIYKQANNAFRPVCQERKELEDMIEKEKTTKGFRPVCFLINMYNYYKTGSNNFMAYDRIPDEDWIRIHNKLPQIKDFLFDTNQSEKIDKIQIISQINNEANTINTDDDAVDKTYVVRMKKEEHDALLRLKKLCSSQGNKIAVGNIVYILLKDKLNLLMQE